LKELDITVLKALSTKTNVIPVIAKADTLTLEERLNLKGKIIADLLKYDVKLYPGGYSDDRDINISYEAYVPFSVIGADSFVDVGGKSMRARKYRWGIVNVEDENHCDFVHLRDMLIQYVLLLMVCYICIVSLIVLSVDRHNLRDIIETCNGIHYFNYRMNRLRSSGRPISVLQSDDQFELQIDSIRKQFTEEMARKEAEIRESLFQKIKQKEASIREAEEAVNFI
jgi:septin family protein